MAKPNSKLTREELTDIVIDVNIKRSLVARYNGIAVLLLQMPSYFSSLPNCCAMIPVRGEDIIPGSNGPGMTKLFDLDGFTLDDLLL